MHGPMSVLLPLRHLTGTTRARSALGGLILLCWGGLVIWLGMMVQREIDAFSTANSDNLQWTLAQADVEFLRFQLALEQAEADPSALDTVRLRFDIFYSRMVTLRDGRLFRALDDTPGFTNPYTRVQDFLGATTPLIDGPEAALAEALPMLTAQTETVGKDIRAFSLAALSSFAELSDRRREGITRLLIYMAAVLMALFLGLTLLAVTLFRLFRLARDRADQVESTSVRLRTIVETSPNAIVVTDEAGEIRAFNAAAERIFGYTRAEACGRPARHLFAPPEASDHALVSVFAFAEERRRPRPEERNFEVTLQARDGRCFPAEFSVDRAETEEPLYVAYIRDITPWKEAEQQLTEARDRALAGERAKSEFLAVMSHEMRTPLNGLLGTMQLLRDHDLGSSPAGLLDRMQVSGQLLLDLVNDVLDLTKVEAGKLALDPAPFSLRDLLDGLVATAIPLAESYGNRLSWHWCGAPRPLVEGDARRLRQVLLNLTGNALKFTRNGKVEIEVEQLPGTGEMIEFRVIDSGIGIAEEQLDRIFEDFETLDSSYAREAGGTGLGLGIARRYTRLMGGEIGAESEAGQGSLFWIRLPLPPAAEVAPEAPPHPATVPPISALEVLVVEDNEINRFIVQRMLERDGHHVTIAENGQMGVQKASSRRFDVILMDISMPVMDGTQATRAIRRGGGPSARAPIIALTAHAFPEERETFRQAGMTAFLTKPVDRMGLRDTLARSVAGIAPAKPQPNDQRSSPLSLLDDRLLDQFLDALPDGAAQPLLARFLQETDREIAALAETAPDAPDLAARAHRCAGSCGTFGVGAMRSALLKIEASLKHETLPAPDDLRALKPIWAMSRKALVARVEAQGGPRSGIGSSSDARRGAAEG
ncbi:MAG: hybrid sensor histidine kinase/response regulator [Rhodobacteraceae bacterium]|jgi:PAS domain S-box-containing protein|nr:hybrid sensor histidine kinase/response regulator [Paracoccaceae bacterium]GGA08101.1 hybrid sensor histidine kinase/response regulator [Salipiger profundus]SFC47890.1 PAS/PAC sensor hybrid histidine kinase [Salipiger profundus]